MASLNLESFDLIVEFAENSSTVLQRITGSQAFRKYNWLSNAPARNTVGNFRGMVVNANARTAFVFVSKVGDAASNLATFLVLLEELKTMSRNIETIAGEGYTGPEMASRVSAEISALCSRVVLKVQVGAASLASLLLTANRYLNPLCSLNTQCVDGTDAVKEILKSWQARLETKIDEVVTGENLYRWVTIYVNG